mmetsp:Transcript_55584/g.180307  ORF Transcript_55584/g.180307 Transcript_55584/m.180307 type:complete len:232 (+) Transcript_55584:316-1011(+)
MFATRMGRRKWWRKPCMANRPDFLCSGQLDGDFRDENDGEGTVGNKPTNGLLCVVHVDADVDCIEQDHGTHDAVQQRLELLLGHVFPQVFDVLRFVLQRLLVGLALLLMDLGVQKHLLQHPRLSLCRGLHGHVECGLSRGNPTHRDLCCRPCWLILDLDHRGMHLDLARGKPRELAPHGHQLLCELGHAELDRAPLTTTHACCDLLDMCVQTIVREAALLRAGEALPAHRG